ncbi:unnamed protein product [Bursaphelenchus okinawaensis]|uniref:Uncharacterized protein n=1 Tax=Bursaphelenchus okinawaensis TaxID=465554 RepID=A0A811K1M9_9BILA|nr:unnamed protein product [Bursaphelenchus okinawaensis]CAG9089172.1 unnamed protein product [Bursaphelenchus okinawaensis]
MSYGTYWLCFFCVERYFEGSVFAGNNNSGCCTWKVVLYTSYISISLAVAFLSMIRVFGVSSAIYAGVEYGSLQFNVSFTTYLILVALTFLSEAVVMLTMDTNFQVTQSKASKKPKEVVNLFDEKLIVANTPDNNFDALHKIWHQPPMNISSPMPTVRKSEKRKIVSSSSARQNNFIK